MDERSTRRKEEQRAESPIPPEVFADFLEQLRPFARPFIDCLTRSEQVEHASTYLGGLLSSIDCKNGEAIA